ncbi:MAG: HEPN domain-containing protein, partial [Candidatus Micrarchaeota archaeon]
MKDEDVLVLIRLRLEQARTAIHDGEVLLREKCSPQSIINRSYYAMFYAALALLQSVGKAPSKHKGVLALFDTDFVQKGFLPRHLSRDIRMAFEARLEADYRSAQVVTHKEAKDFLDKAKTFVNAVTSFLTSRQ